MNNSMLISHSQEVQSFSVYYDRFKNKILESECDVDRLLRILEQLSQFGLGRFFIVNKGLNGYWTHYAVVNYEKSDPSYNDMECFLLNKAPGTIANYERFKNMQKLLQENLEDNLVLASVPSGLMDDLLLLDYSKVKGIKLVGIDLDEESLHLAEKNAERFGLLQNCEFVLKDAWEISGYGEYDILTSSGLNTYEPEDNKVEELYNVFYNSLKKGGKAILSCLTPPPGIVGDSEWIMTEINMSDLMLQKAIFGEILGITNNRSIYRTVEKTTRQMQKVGFKNIQVYYDRAHTYPVFLGLK